MNYYLSRNKTLSPHNRNDNSTKYASELGGASI